MQQWSEDQLLNRIEDLEEELNDAKMEIRQLMHQLDMAENEISRLENYQGDHYDNERW